MGQQKEITDVTPELIEFRERINEIKCINTPLRNALCSQMKSLLNLRGSGFFSIICNNSIDALIDVVNGAIKSQNKTDVNINEGLEVFVEALNVTLQSYLFTDSFMLEFLSANAEVYGVRNKLSLEYANYISECIKFLESDKEKRQRTKYLFKPSLSSSVSVVRIWNVEPPVCIIRIPTEMMLKSPKKLLFMIAHEVSHYAGRKFRKCQERNKAIKKLSAIIFAEYSVNYFNMQIGRSSIEETTRIKNERKERILAAIKHVRNGYDLNSMYSAFCEDLKTFFQTVIESVEFIEAFNLGLRDSMLIYDYTYLDPEVEKKKNTPKNRTFLAEVYLDNLRKNALTILTFFMNMTKECIADIISAKVLGISDVCEYIRIDSYNELAYSDGWNMKNGDYNYCDILKAETPGLKEGTLGDFDSFSRLVRKLIVAEVISRKSCFTEEDKSTIGAFNIIPIYGMPNTSNYVFLDFIKHMIFSDKLNILFDLLSEVNSQEDLSKDNPCRLTFNRVKNSEHAEDYFESII